MGPNLVAHRPCVCVCVCVTSSSFLLPQHHHLPPGEFYHARVAWMHSHFTIPVAMKNIFKVYLSFGVLSLFHKTKSSFFVLFFVLLVMVCDILWSLIHSH